MKLDMQSAERDTGAIAAMLAQAAGHLHLPGIGGVGMAGLAVLLKNRGFRVSGCDCAPSHVTAWLEREGIPVFIGHEASHMQGDVLAVIRSMAVPPDIDELCAAREAGIPVFLRGAALAAVCGNGTSVAVSGTHGKTTTTAMLAQVVAACGLASEFCIGGEVAALGGVAGGTPGGVLVAEADESDGTVALYHPCWSVITNIEFDHMEHFGSRREVEDCFARLVAQTRRRVFYCADDPVASQLARSSDKALGYGFSDAADIRISGFREQEGAAAFCIAHEGGVEMVRLPLAGRHNALNAAAAFTVAKNVGCEPCRIVEALAVCAPPRRRFETIVKTPVHVISDYAHHPTEIRALIGMTHHLQARRIVAVFQPHRYTRTRALGAQFPAAFAGVDEVVLAPVYAASESSSGGDTSQDLLAHFEQHGGTKTLLSDSLQNAWQYVRGILQEGDVLLLVGAGDIERMGPWAVEFFSDVQEKE